MKLFNIFKKEQKKKSTRGFKGALKTRFTSWLLNSFTKINVDTKQEFKQLISRVRDLSKNNEVFRSHLNNLEKSIIGKQGFRLQSLVKASTGELDTAINDELEFAWYDFGKRSNGYLTKCRITWRS
jgi:capsid protein